MIILAIETSCDETAVAVVEFRKGKVNILSNIVSSQVKAHSKFGGVVPSLAVRMHLRNMVPVLRRALKEAEKYTFENPHDENPHDENPHDENPPSPLCERGRRRTPPLKKEAGGIFKNKIDYIAVTKGPGLIPALTIGVSAAKALAYSWDKPLVGVNHLEGHIYANWLQSNGDAPHPNPLPRGEGARSSFFTLWKPEFPVLCLIVSGGHTQLVLMKKDLSYKIIGETMDDAAGEAFDKVAKLLGLGYPGGPLIEKMAKKGDKNKFKFPRPMMNSGNYNFSFSGLKTAVLYEVKSRDDAPHPNPLPRGEGACQYQADVAASFQEAVIDVLISKTIKAAKQYKVKNIILGGGVSANKELQKQFGEKIPPAPFAKGGVAFQVLNTKLTTDNALMIAIAAYYNIIGKKNIGNWKNMKADANLKISTLP